MNDIELTQRQRRHLSRLLEFKATGIPNWWRFNRATNEKLWALGLVVRKEKPTGSFAELTDKGREIAIQRATQEKA